MACPGQALFKWEEQLQREWARQEAERLVRRVEVLDRALEILSTHGGERELSDLMEELDRAE